jgi:hypothetical protein
MVARTRPTFGLALILEREGRELFRRHAIDGSAAARTAVIMIAELGALQGGDCLTVEPDDTGDHLVEVLRRPDSPDQTPYGDTP